MKILAGHTRLPLLPLSRMERWRRNIKITYRLPTIPLKEVASIQSFVHSSIWKYFPFVCETCIQKLSDSDSTEKYTLHYHMSTGPSSLYVIETLNANVYKDSCYEMEFWKDTALILSNDICNSFKNEISSKAHRSTETPKLPQKKYTLCYNERCTRLPLTIEERFGFVVKAFFQSHRYAIAVLARSYSWM